MKIWITMLLLWVHYILKAGEDQVFIVVKNKFNSINKGTAAGGVTFADPLTHSISKGSFMSKNNSVAFKMAYHLNELKLMQKFDEACEKEFEELARSIINLKEKSQIGFGGVCTLEPVDVITAIVNLTIMPGVHHDVYCLKVLRKVIEVENNLTMKPAAEWTGEEDDPTPEIFRNQNLLASCNACNLVANLIKNEKGDAVTNEALLLGIALLIGGNNGSQMKFWEFMIEDMDNKFLTVLSEILKVNFFKVMDYTEEYNKLAKKINELKRNKFDEAGPDQDDGNYEELEELIQYKERLESRKLPDEEEEEDFNSITYSVNVCIRILRFLQLLCENHNIKLQDHLREQNNKDGVTLGKNFNFPTFASNMLGIYAKHSNEFTMDLGGQLIETLIEFVQGPSRGNQKALITAKVVENCRDFISNSFQENEFEGGEAENTSAESDDGDSQEKLIITLLVALLEGVPDHLVIDKMSQSLDLHLMKERMYCVYKQFVINLIKPKNTTDDNIANITIHKDSLRMDSFDSPISEGFDIFILFQILSDNSKEMKEKLQDSEFTPCQKKAKEFFAANVGRIEILVNDVLERTYFPVLPLSRYLTRTQKDAFKSEAERTSPSTKIRSLMESSKTIIMEMKHFAKVDSNK